MTLDHLRKLVAEERARAVRMMPGPHDFDGPALCDAVDLLVAVVDALPKCNGEWLSGSGGHVVYSHDCDQPATTWDPDSSVDYDYQCDRHLAMVHECHHRFREDLPYATPLRAMLAKGPPR